MTNHAIVKQIAEQLKGRLSIDEEKGYSKLYPFDTSIDGHLNPVKIFTDPRDKKEYILDYKDDGDRLSQLKKINTVILAYNKEALKNHGEFQKKIPIDGKLYSDKEVGFDKPLQLLPEFPLWGFAVLGKTEIKDYDRIKPISIDDRKLYRLRIEMNNDSVFIAHLNRLIFNHIQIKRKESEKMGTWDSDNIWYKPNQRFHKWFQINNISVENNVSKGGRPKGTTKRTINRYIKIFKNFELLKKKFTSNTKSEIYEMLSLENYDGKTYSRATIKNIIEQKKYNMNPSQ
jgi:hypothetical protein